MARHPVAPWELDLQAPLRGQVIYVRRTTERGDVHLLGRTFAVDPLRGFRLVRCEVDLTAERIRCYALRRRQPDHQLLLAELPYAVPRCRLLGERLATMLRQAGGPRTRHCVTCTWRVVTPE